MRDKTIEDKLDDLLGRPTREEYARGFQRWADAPLRPRVPQEACDHGLFSDESAQTDLVDMARRILTPRE
jgi:hypothetical protein